MHDLPVAARRAVSWLFFLNGALFGTWVSRIPLVQETHSLGHAELGVALLGLAFGALVAMPFCGWASARFGSRRVCQAGAVFYTLVLPCIALAPDPITLKIALFLFGAGHGGLDVPMNGQAVLVERKYQRPVMSSFHALFSAGGLAGAVLGAAMAAGSVPVVIHFTVVALLLGSYVIFTSFKPLLYDEHEPTHEAAQEGSHKQHRPRVPLKHWLGLGAMGALAFCVMMGEGAMADWSALYLKQVTGASEAVASAGYGAFSLTMMLGRFGGDALTLRWGPERLVRISGALAASGLALALITAQPIPAFIGFAAVGAGFATVIPQVFSAAGRASTAGLPPGLALATVTTVGYGGFLLGPPAIGFLAEHTGLRNALGLVVFTSTIVLLLAWAVRPTRAVANPRESQPVDGAALAPK